MQTVCVFCRNVASQRAPGLKEREREGERESSAGKLVSKVDNLYPLYYKLSRHWPGS